MTDLLNLVLLIAVSAGSLAFGVLAAYGIFRVAFALMRPQGRPAVAKPQAQPEAARVS
jgi:hypothetical protein